MVCPRAKVTIGSLKEVTYRESIGIKMNDLDLCFLVVLRSCEPLPHLSLNILETIRDRGLVPKDHQ